MEDIRELVIMSGKGGSGKTSVAASFAKLSTDAIIADCDVDAADMYLVLEHAKLSTEDFYSGYLASIDHDKCVNCGKCLELCRFNAITTDKDIYEVNELNCEGCGVCFDNCPHNAINFPKRLSGEVYISKTPASYLVHAKLGTGGENSGKLVAYVKTKAKEIASRDNMNKIIVDGPPGIGCPGIACLSGAWRCLLVTEPTKSGLHDLERILKLTEHFRVPAYVCVNKADINPEISEEIKAYTISNGHAYMGELPFDKTVTEAQRNGKTVVEYPSPIAEGIKQLYEDIFKD